MTAGAGIDIGRRIKAARIAAAIRSLGGGAHEARQFSDAEWLLADKVSRKQSGMVVVRKSDAPPSEVTRSLVLEILSRPEPPAWEPGEPRDEDAPPE